MCIGTDGSARICRRARHAVQADARGYPGHLGALALHEVSACLDRPPLLRDPGRRDVARLSVADYLVEPEALERPINQRSHCRRGESTTAGTIDQPIPEPRAGVSSIKAEQADQAWPKPRGIRGPATAVARPRPGDRW
jgi:hypothetical protein